MFFVSFALPFLHFCQNKTQAALTPTHGSTIGCAQAARVVLPRSSTLEGDATGNRGWCHHIILGGAIATSAEDIIAEANYLPVSTEGTGVAVAANHRAIGMRPAVINQCWHRLVFSVARAQLV